MGGRICGRAYLWEGVSVEGLIHEHLVELRNWWAYLQGAQSRIFTVCQYRSKERMVNKLIVYC